MIWARVLMALLGSVGTMLILAALAGFVLEWLYVRRWFPFRMSESEIEADYQEVLRMIER